MGKWYDACSGWATTGDRIQVFDFSSPYLKTEKAHLYIKKGSNFNIATVSAKKIGWFIMRVCNLAKGCLFTTARRKGSPTSCMTGLVFMAINPKNQIKLFIINSLLILYLK